MQLTVPAPAAYCEGMGLLKPSPPEESCGCLFALIGAAAGMWYNSVRFSQFVAETRANDPNAVVCGLPAVGGMIGFGMLGFFMGGVAGMIAGHVLRRRHRQSTDQSAEN